MNLARFNATIWSLHQEIESNETQTLFTQVVNTLQQSIGQPSADTAKAFQTSFNELIKILSEAPSNEAPPSRRRIYRDLECEDKIGLGLSNKIGQIIQKNNITPANALQDMQELNTELNEFWNAITNMAKSLDELDVEYDELNEDEYEVGITIPETILKANLSNVENEIHCLNELFNVLSEVATGEVGHFKIRTIGSTDLEIFLNTTAVVGACVATCIKQILALYQHQLEIKKVKLELEAIKAPKSVTQPFDEHVRDTVQKEIKSIAKAMLTEFYKTKDTGRKNELNTHLAKVIEYMAERIDKGASFEVRVGLPEEPEEPTGATEDETAAATHKKKLAAYQKEKKAIYQLNEAGRSIGQIERQDEEILKLPEPYKPEDGSGTNK